MTWLIKALNSPNRHVENRLPPTPIARNILFEKNGRLVRAPTPHPLMEPSFNGRLRAPTSKLSKGQIIYLIVLRALTAMVISGGLGLLAGYFIYSSPRPPYGPPPMGSIPPFIFRQPKSLVLDALLTTFVQCILTFMTQQPLVNHHMAQGRVRGLHVCPEPKNRLLRWWFMLDCHTQDKGSALFGGCFNWVPGHRLFGLFFGSVGRGLITVVPAFAVMIGPTIALLVAAGTPYDGDWVFLGRWDGFVFKGMYSAVLGLILAPALAIMWMVRAGWIYHQFVGRVPGSSSLSGSAHGTIGGRSIGGGSDVGAWGVLGRPGDARKPGKGLGGRWPGRK
ncbi:hypothetical protein VTJ49DRAFT_1490 [Mycothermus thermophilus]|uniref:Uncharacterized protein n=1 Tax=Humicola insolens TaxID=85995 RepID=A0ABR3VCM4_HUMIN